MAPRPYSVTRSIEVDAPASAIFARLADFHEWRSWSPWEGADANMQRTYEGAASGVGAMYTWAGNRRAGAGSMTITRAEEPSRVTVDLRFTRPFASRSEVVFAISDGPSAGSSRVEWSMRGEQNGLARVLGFVVPMDRVVGPQFETGLRSLKALTESTRE